MGTVNNGFMGNKEEVKIYIAGHNGMVGSSCYRLLMEAGYPHLLIKTSNELDLRNQTDVDEFFKHYRPNVVIDAAARVGGILANEEHPYTFLMENMQIQNNLIAASLKYNVRKFVFLGSSCIYPKMASQPIKEEYLLTDALEPTNEWYAIAKISGVKACEAIRKQFGRDFVSLMPANLYGPNDNFDLYSSHVLPAMIRKFHEAKLAGHTRVTLWGDGSPLREFLHVDDLSRAVLFALEHQLPEHLYNVGYGTDITILKLAETVQHIVGHKGPVSWDGTKPNGTPKKIMDSTKLMVSGWKPIIGLQEGIKTTYKWFLEHQENYKKVKL